MSYSTEWIPGLFFFGFVALFWVPPVALIGLTLFILVLLAAIVATPFLLGRYLLRRLRARHHVERERHEATAPAVRPSSASAVGLPGGAVVRNGPSRA